MAHYQGTGDSAINWYRSYTTSDAMKYQAYHQAAMHDPYTAKGLNEYHARYAALHQQYQWYNLAREARNPWMCHYMYQHYGMARYSQQPWGMPRRNDTSRNQNYQHQHQLPYLLFHQPSLQSSPASHLIPQSQQKEITVPSSLGHGNQNLECTTQRTESPIFGAESRTQNPTKIVHGKEVLNAENVRKMIMEDKRSSLRQSREGYLFPGAKTATGYETSEKPWQSHHLKYVHKESSCSRQTPTNNADQENFGKSEYLSKPNISAAARDTMSQIMLERELQRAGKGHLAVPLMKDSKIAMNLLEDEKVGNFRHQNVNESVSLNLSGTVFADKDLEELIFIDQHLDDIINSLDRKNTTTVEPQSDLLDTDAKRNKDERSTTRDVSDAGAGRQQKQKRRRKRVEHICTICGERFTCRASKNVHMRIHSGERPYECPHCDRRFAHRPSLTTHIRTHTGEKPYPCHDCGRAFSNYSSWQKHSRLHTGEKPYTCAICKKAFSQSSNLKRHRKIHFRSATKKFVRRPSLGFG